VYFKHFPYLKRKKRLKIVEKHSFIRRPIRRHLKH